MIRGARGAASLAAVVLMAAVAARGGEAAKPAPAKPKPSTHKVAAKPLKIDLELKGVFEAETMAEVVFQPKVWATLVVERAVASGTRVKKGDEVVALRVEKIDDAIKAAEAGLVVAQLGVKLMQDELVALEEAMPMDLAAAERAKAVADEDLTRYLEVDRPLWIRKTEFSVKTAENHLAYVREELRQLEKMYQADDLTEETEEIILKRQRDAVERTEFSVEQTKIGAEKTLKVDVPRQDIVVKENAKRQAIALAKAKGSLPVAIRKKRLEFEKAQVGLKKATENLDKLKADRAAMVVKAPADGIVYAGPCVRGNWPQLNLTLKAGTALKPNQVVATIVAPRPMFVRAGVAEKLLERVSAGIKGWATPTGYPGLRLRATLTEVSEIPESAGSFGSRIAVELPKAAKAVVPGMTCAVKLVAYRKDDALTVPVGAVFTSDADGSTAVYVQKGKDGHEKRAVTVGRRTEKVAEIVAGLKAGEVVLLRKPKGAK